METGKLKLALSAGALALSMALAGCGGSSSSGGAATSTTSATTTPSTPLNCTGGEVANLAGTACITRLTAAQCPANGVNSAGNACNPAPAEPEKTPFEMAGGTPGALLIASGPRAGLLNREARPETATGFGQFGTVTTAAFNALKPTDKIEGLNGSENPGMTWFNALGAGKTSLTIITGGNPVVGEGYALKVTGEDVSDFEFSTVSAPSEGSSSTKGAVLGLADGTQVEYMGINGVLICNGDSCSANDDNQLTGDWYFQARAESGTDPDTTLWVKKGKEYALRSTQPHADWGVWLSDADGNGPGKDIEWYAHGSSTGSLTFGPVAGLSNTATYEGPAVGVSTLSKTEDKAATVGSFTATAKLTATFGTSPTVSGKITDFKGNAVNDKWELELQSSAIETSGALGDSGTGTNRATKVGSVSIANTWNAQLYGEENSRPSGVVGEFDGRFDDGQAVGVFHAK